MPKPCRFCGNPPDLVVYVKREEQADGEPVFPLCRNCFDSEMKAIETIIALEEHVQDWWIE